MKRFLLLGFALVMLVSFVVGLLPSKSSALGNTFPDLADTSGSGNFNNTSSETQFVQKSDSNLRVWFPTSNGTVSITDANYCASNKEDSIQNGDYFASNTIPNLSIITTYNFNSGKSIQYGRKYASGNSNCIAKITYSVTGIPATQVENGYYYINLDISHNSLHAGNCSNAGISGCDGIKNNYTIASSAGSIIGVRTNQPNGLGNTGYDTTQEQVTTTPAYSTYYAYFGSPCSLKVNTRAYLSFFDLDNASVSGAQPPGVDINIRLWDRTTASYTTLSNGSTVWTPPSVENAAQSISFIAIPDHKYRLDIINVYYNNAIQYSVPYAQIYNLPCVEATIDPAAEVSAATIKLGQSVTFRNYVGVTGTKNTGTDTFDYAIGFTKPATATTPANATKSAAVAPLNISLDPDRPNATNGPIDTLTFTPDAEGTYCRSTTVSGYPVTYAKITLPNPENICVVVGPPAVSPGWTASATTKAVGTDAAGISTTGTAGGTINLTVGDKFYFKHTITNDNLSASSTTSPIDYSTGGASEVKDYSGTIPIGLAPNGSLGLGVSGDAYIIKAGDIGKLFCKDIKFDPTSSTDTGSFTSQQACVRVVAPIPRCTGTISTVPGRIQPGDSVVITIGFNSSTSAQTLNYSFSGGLALNGSNITIAAGASSYSLPAIIVPNTAAVYSAVWNVSSATGDCTGSVSVVDMPYFTVSGTGVRAGGGFSGSCNSGGTLAAWHNYSGGNNYGAGAQLSAIAMIAITGFASKQVPASTTPTGHSFANTTTTNSVDSPTLGGDFGGSYCFSQPKAPADVQDAAATFDLTGQSGAYKFSGDVTLNASNIANSTNVSLFVDGDVYIDGDIEYTNTTWSAQSEIPSVVIVARNIHIDPSVTKLDGMYVATDSASASDGNIFTCADSSGTIASANLYGQCNNQLVVHGSFVAKRINLMRTYGTLKDATTNVGCRNAGTPASLIAANCAAEVFEFSPEMYLSSPAIQQQSNGALRYDAISNLPPIL